MSNQRLVIGGVEISLRYLSYVLLSKIPMNCSTWGLTVKFYDSKKINDILATVKSVDTSIKQ